MKLEIRDYRNAKDPYGKSVSVEFDINWLKGILAALMFSGEPKCWTVGGYSLWIHSFECREDVLVVNASLEGKNRYLMFNPRMGYTFLPIFDIVPPNPENDD